MEFTLKDYKGHKYIEYNDEKNGKHFTNANYFIFDLNEEFDEIMSSTGGFTAEMTTRMIKKLGIPCESIMLCSSPNSNNTFLFQFVYLGHNREVLNIEWDNNYFDYEYFHKKFADCIVEEGCIFDLLQHDSLKEVTKEFKTPTVDFGINIDGKEVAVDDVLVCDDLCFLKDECKEKWKEYGVTHAELRFDFDCFNAFHFKAKFVKEDGSYLPRYQAQFDCETIEQFIEECGGGDEGYYSEPYEASVLTSIARQLSSHFTLKSGECVDKSEGIDIERWHYVNICRIC